MCESVTFLYFLLIMKILTFIIFPFVLLFFKNKFKYQEYFYLINIVLIIIFLVFRFSNNICILNSSVKRINEIKIKDKLIENYNYNDELKTDKIVLTSKLKTISNKDLLYYNLNSEDNIEKTYLCDGDKKFYKFYQENIFSIASILSYTIENKVTPDDLVALSLENGIMDCNSPVDTLTILDLISNKYQINYKIISPLEIENYLLNDYIILLQTKGNMELSSALTCNVGYSIIYNKDSDGNFILASSNDKKYDYICPDNTYGYGSVVRSNINENTWTFNALSAQASMLIIMEKR